MRAGRTTLSLAVAAACVIASPAAAAAGPPRAAIAPVAAAVALDSPAAALRVLLGRLLSEHAFLSMEQMRAIASGRPDAGAATAALGENTAELTEAITSVYGAAAGNVFGQLWAGHIAGLEAFAHAVRAGDDAARRDAHAKLEADLRAFGDWLAGANPNLTAAGVNDLLHLHVDQLTSYVEQDFEAAFVTERQAFHHMFETGDTLASAIISQFPDRFPGRGEGFSPAVSLWLALDRLLGEHLVLAAEAMRAGQGDAAEFEAARKALDDNSSDLAASVGSIYGEDAGSAFDALWRSHISAYLAYIEALRDDDEAAQAEHRSVLEAYAGRFGTFMGNANPHLDATAATHLIEHHTVALLDQVDAYADGDYEAAYQSVREAYEHMFSVGKALAIALAEQFPARFPVLPASSTDAPPQPRWPVALLPLLLIVTAIVMRLAAARPSGPARSG